MSVYFLFIKFIKSNNIGIKTFISECLLPAKIDIDSDKAERELILRQLLYLRQDVSELKQMLVAPKDLEDLYENDVKSI